MTKYNFIFACFKKILNICADSCCYFYNYSIFVLFVNNCGTSTIVIINFGPDVKILLFWTKNKHFEDKGFPYTWFMIYLLWRETGSFLKYGNLEKILIVWFFFWKISTILKNHAKKKEIGSTHLRKTHYTFEL